MNSALGFRALNLTSPAGCQLFERREGEPNIERDSKEIGRVRLSSKEGKQGDPSIERGSEEADRLLALVGPEENAGAPTPL